MQLGVLKKKTHLNTVAGIRITLPKGTIVKVAQGKVIFEDKDIEGFRVSGKYFIQVADTIFMLEPFEPKAPFPFSRI